MVEAEWNFFYEAPCGTKMTGKLRLKDGYVEIAPGAAHGGRGSITRPSEWRLYLWAPPGKDDEASAIQADSPDAAEDWFSARGGWSLVRVPVSVKEEA